MFRDSKASFNEQNVGVGSVICGGYDNIEESWLIVGTSTGYAYLVCNKTFMFASEAVKVEDLNYLSSNEVRQLLHAVSNKLNWTFTDFFVSSKGMKNVLFDAKGAK